MFNVIHNVADSFESVAKADYVLAFCGTEMFVIKSRNRIHTAVEGVPCRPDKVIGYYRFPEPEVREIRLRRDSTEVSM